MSAHVYRVFDGGGMCLYVGATTNLFPRLRHHRLNTRWGIDAAKVRATVHPDMDEARTIEAAEIRALRPRHNINGRGHRQFWTACDYVEVIDERILRDRPVPPLEKHRVAFAAATDRLLREFGRRFPGIAELVVRDSGWSVAA